MARMRGVAPFGELWDRRTTLTMPDGMEIETLSLPDLVAAKKTQRDKDWPMISRLLEVSYDQGWASSTPSRIDFWLSELRTPELLIECVARFQTDAARHAEKRVAVRAAAENDVTGVVEALAAEEAHERLLDRQYWEPLRRELQQLRRGSGL